MGLWRRRARLVRTDAAGHRRPDGVNAQGQVFFANGAQQELYELARASQPLSPRLAIGPDQVSHAEGASGGTAFAFTLTRTGPTDGTGSATWSVSGSGAHPADAADFVGGALPQGTVSFAAGETSKTITVNVAGDGGVETDETFTVTLANPTGFTLQTATATGVIVNDDTTGGGGGTAR
jgi:hypothetical protein